MSEQLTVLDHKPPTRPVLIAGARPQAIVPTTLEEAWRLAEMITKARMAPSALDSPEKVAVVILHGLEVGLMPMTALQSIAMINGRPVIWGDGAVGLIRASGLLEYMHEKFEGEGNNLTAVCIVKRRGEPEPVRGEFSWSDVVRAGLNKKGGTWQTYPRRMMQMRARWPLRDVFADVLKGLSLREEVEDMGRQDAPVPAPPESAPPPEQKVRRVPPPPAPPTKAAPQVEKPTDGFPGDTPMEPKQDPISSGLPDKPLNYDEQKWLIGLRDGFECCDNLDEVASVWESDGLPATETVSRSAFREAHALHRSALERFADHG